MSRTGRYAAFIPGSDFVDESLCYRYIDDDEINSRVAAVKLKNHRLSPIGSRFWNFIIEQNKQRNAQTST